MPRPALAEIDPRILGGALLAVAAGILLLEAWGWRTLRRRRKLAFPVLRRPVPWGFADLALIAAVFYSGFILWAFLWEALVPRAAPADKYLWMDTNSSEHPLIQMMQSGQWSGLIVAGISAVLVAPLVEEYFFRVFLQGWLENVERRHWRILRRCCARGVLPVLFSALPFAAMHFHVAGRQPAGDYLLFLLAGNAVASLSTFVFALIWMRVVRGATAADLGWKPEKLLADLRSGVLLFIALIVPLYLIQGGVKLLLPEGVAPDPLPLFVLAVVLGTAYYSTHRVAIPLSLHAAINSFGFFTALGSYYFNR